MRTEGGKGVSHMQTKADMGEGVRKQVFIVDILYGWPLLCFIKVLDERQRVQSRQSKRTKIGKVSSQDYYLVLYLDET